MGPDANLSANVALRGLQGDVVGPLRHAPRPSSSLQSYGHAHARHDKGAAPVGQSHRLHSDEDLEQAIRRYVWLYNSHLPQSVLKGRTPIDALKDRHRDKPELFKKRSYHHTGCDRPARTGCR